MRRKIVSKKAKTKRQKSADMDRLRTVSYLTWGQIEDQVRAHLKELKVSITLDIAVDAVVECLEQRDGDLLDKCLAEFTVEEVRETIKKSVKRLYTTEE